MAGRPIKVAPKVSPEEGELCGRIPRPVYVCALFGPSSGRVFLLAPLCGFTFSACTYNILIYVRCMYVSALGLYVWCTYALSLAASASCAVLWNVRFPNLFSMNSSPSVNICVLTFSLNFARSLFRGAAMVAPCVGCACSGFTCERLCAGCACAGLRSGRACVGFTCSGVSFVVLTCTGWICGGGTCPACTDIMNSKKGFNLCPCCAACSIIALCTSSGRSICMRFILFCFG